MPNRILNGSSLRRNDEFYTQYEDVELELSFYPGVFRDKTVYCNCDDYRVSAFWRYFHLRFSELGLKRLIASCAYPEPWLAIYDGGSDTDVGSCSEKRLLSNGDFRSTECAVPLMDADIIVSNPPFSIYPEYVEMLIRSGKKFITIGNMNSVAYKTIFPLIREGKLWTGANEKGGSRRGNSMWFFVPDDYPGRTVEKNGRKTAEATAWWFTNLEHTKRNVPLRLTERYSEQYQALENYDAIDVSRCKKIPVDYSGVMAVPITFLRYYDPDQFEILGLAAGNTRATGLNYTVPYTPHPDDRGGCAIVDGQRLFARILIRRRASGSDVDDNSSSRCASSSNLSSL